MNQKIVNEAERLYEIFNSVSIKVVDELINQSLKGYDYDMQTEVSFYKEVKEYLTFKYNL